MDSKSRVNNGIESPNELPMSSTKSRINDTEALSKHIPTVKLTEPKHRVIKQIVSLDSKKLKALGIESNILSALTKFNGKDKLIAKQPTATVKTAEASTSPIQCSVDKTTASKQIIAIPSISPPIKPSDARPTKKIQVLSDVLLSGNKVDLNHFTAIASSTPAGSETISCVSQVPRPSQIKPIRCVDKSPFKEASTSIVIPPENVRQQSAETKVLIQKLFGPTKLPIKCDETPAVDGKNEELTDLLKKSADEHLSKLSSKCSLKSLSKSRSKSPMNSAVVQSNVELEPNTNEIDALKGFTLPEVECSQNQFETLQSEICHKPTEIVNTMFEHQNEIESDNIEIEEIDEIDEDDESDVIVEVIVEEEPEYQLEIDIKEETFDETSSQNANLSESITTSDIMSSDSSSSDTDSESDLNELIIEAKMTIENERNAEQMVSPETTIVTKKPRLVQKKLLDQLAEHIDKDRLIDEFLDSTINSFRTSKCENPQTSDSSDDDHDNDVTRTPNDSNEMEETAVEPFIVSIDTEDIPMMALKHEAIELVEVAKSTPRKRKISNKLEINTKRKKSQSIIKPNKVDIKIERSIATETQPSTTNVATADVIGDDEGVTTVQRVKDIPETSKTPKSLENQPTPVQPKSISSAQPNRSIKPKQSILNDYFAVKNQILNETKRSLLEVMDTVPAKSSRYGRVIKPKSFDIEVTPKAKTERKSRKEVNDVPLPHSLPIKMKMKTDSSTVSMPLKKRSLINHTEHVEYIIPDRDIPTHESAIGPAFDNESEQSFVNSTPISLTSRRKFTITSPLIDTIAESSHLDKAPVHSSNIHGDSFATPKESTKRGRKPKNLSAIKAIETPVMACSTPPIETDPGHSTFHDTYQIVDEIIIKEEYVQTPVNEIRKRGRPRKSLLDSSAYETTSQRVTNDTNVPNQNMPSVTILDHLKTPQNVIPKRRGRKNIEISEDESSQSANESINETIASTSQSVQSSNEPTNQLNENQIDEKTPRKQGRPRIKPLVEKPPSLITYTCGNCQIEVPQNKWKVHEATHIGVTFRIGIDDPIDVEDPATMARIMIRFMKHNKIQYLKCPKCHEKKKSAVGYISHIEVCGLTPDEIASLKTVCEYCKKLYRKVSIVSHQQGFCPVRRLEMAQHKADELENTIGQEDENIEVIYSESGRPKRMIKKAKPYLKVIEDFIKVGLKITGGTCKSWTNQLREENVITCSNENCAFTSTDVNDMRTHYKQCIESVIYCKICLKGENSRDDIVQHIETMHPEVLKQQESDNEFDFSDNDDDFKADNQTSSCSDDDFMDDDFEHGMPKKNLKRKKRSVPLKRVMEDEAPAFWEMFSAFYTRILNLRPGYHKKSYQWTKKFVEENYDLGALALSDHMRNAVDIVRLSQREVNKFLGLLHSKSARFSCQKQTEYQLERAEASAIDNWSNLNLFESVKTTHIQTESAILFCGGKIITADWIPFPKNYSGNQVLVICSQSQGVKPLNLTNCMPMEKCKSLIQLWSVSTKSNTEIEATDFMYGIAYEDGPIYTISFCPSDAYVATKRLAIAALPDTVGNINIISIPDNVSKAKSNTSTFVKVKPEIRLRMCFKMEESTSQTVTQLVWSRTKGHKVLCAGFSTGFIAVWNFDHLNSTYMCTKKTSDGIPVLLPQYNFIGALSFITQLDIHSDNDGNVRWLLVGALDRKIRLYDLQDPQLIPFTSPIYRSRVISGTWPLHWPIYLTIIDAVLTRQNGGLQIKPVLYTNNQPSNATLYNDCEPSNLAFSDWLNTGIFGNEVGDLFMLNFQQLIMYDRSDESSEQKIISCTDVYVDDQHDNDNTYNNTDANERIRILFQDFDETVFSPKITKSPNFAHFPHARITRVAINPNESHHKLYAIGYELGFCRIRFIPE